MYIYADFYAEQHINGNIYIYCNTDKFNNGYGYAHIHTEQYRHADIYRDIHGHVYADIHGDIDIHTDFYIHNDPDHNADAGAVSIPSGNCGV